MSFNRNLIIVISVFYVLTIISIECSETNSLLDTVLEESRKRKRPFFMKPFAAYTWLASLVAIKIKVAVIVFTVLSIGALFLKGFIGYFGKFWWPGCSSNSGVIYSGHEIISDVPPPSYHSHHHDYDLDHSGSMMYYNRVKYPVKSSGVKNTGYSGTSVPTRQTREVHGISRDDADRIIRSIESFKPISRIEEICKRRYVCESDVRATHSVAAAYQLYFFGREGLAKYRDRTQPKPRTYEECAQLYKECSDPMKILYGKRRRKRNTIRKWNSTLNNNN